MSEDRADVYEAAYETLGIPIDEVHDRMGALHAEGFALVPLELIDNLRSAVRDEGQQPAHHRAVIMRLSRSWPTLWSAVDALVMWEGRGR